jgi:hypothetical protein
MAKKSFSEGLNSLLESTVEEENEIESSSALFRQKRGRPRTSFKTITKATQEGTKEGEERATFIVRIPLIEKIKAVAFWDRMQIKDVVNNALEAYLNQKGEKHVSQALQAFRKKEQGPSNSRE